ncbi:hypothetical protein D3C87_1617730 [compost metagenome]
MSMLVMMAQSASMMFVASRRPPRPTSRIATSSSEWLISRKIASVVNSKYVSDISLPFRVLALSTASKFAIKSEALTISPWIRHRSSKCTRCGDV